MTPKVIFIVAASCGILSCMTSADSGRSDADVSGVYVREYAYEISNPETGKKLGMRQVSDSIFIEQTENGYRVSNRKWRMNDYDEEGWVSMAHSEDRPLPSFVAAYDVATGLLTSQNQSTNQKLLIDEESEKLFRDKAREIEYAKVR